MLLLGLLWGVSWNPLGTSWKAYGHPLYPFASVNNEKHPVQDLTWDLQGNKDAQRLGRFGSFCHAYISPSGTLAFIRYISGNAGFSPDRLWWNGQIPISLASRLAIWTLVLVLLVFRDGRLFAWGGILLMLGVSADKVGFIRYQPWLSALGCLAVVLTVDWLSTLMPLRISRWLSSVVLVLLAVVAGCWGMRHARDIDFKAKEYSHVPRRIRPKFWGGPPSGYLEMSLMCNNFAARYNYLHCMENRTRLLLMQLGWKDMTMVLPPEGMTRYARSRFEWDERNWPCKKESADDDGFDGLALSTDSWKEYNVWDGTDENDSSEAWILSPWGWWVPLADGSSVVDYFTVSEIRDGESWARRQWRRMKDGLHTWIKVYPRQVVHRLCTGSLGT